MPRASERSAERDNVPAKRKIDLVNGTDGAAGVEDKEGASGKSTKLAKISSDGDDGASSQPTPADTPKPDMVQHVQQQENMEEVLATVIV
ncbi:hypothetical protein BG004_002339 [Podila humilis]|nr:hypothetical protein BG004_002339 [Podila humilis]